MTARKKVEDYLRGKEYQFCGESIKSICQRNLGKEYYYIKNMKG